MRGWSAKKKYMQMGSGLFGDFGGPEGGVTTTDPQPQDTILLAIHSLQGPL